jgi:hypothetical protein
MERRPWGLRSQGANGSVLLVTAICTRAPDESMDADQTYRQVKSGYLSGLSIGFNPIQTEPMYGGGMRVARCQLIEISVCSIPAQSQSLINDRYFPPPLPGPVPNPPFAIGHCGLQRHLQYQLYCGTGQGCTIPLRISHAPKAHAASAEKRWQMIISASPDAGFWQKNYGRN